MLGGGKGPTLLKIERERRPSFLESPEVDMDLGIRQKARRSALPGWRLPCCINSGAAAHAGLIQRLTILYRISISPLIALRSRQWNSTRP